MFLFENKTKLQIYEIFFSFKGIFYPKKQQHLSSFTHPQISSVEHKMLMGKVDVYINKLH